MEKDIKSPSVEVVQSNQGNTTIFQLKDPKMVNKTILSEIKQEMSYPSKGTIIIYPDQKIIECNQILVQIPSAFI